MNKIIYLLIIFLSSCVITKEEPKKKEVWEIYVLFVSIKNWENPLPSDVLIVRGPLFSSLKTCIKGSSSWVIWKLQNLNFLYDWQRGMCKTKDITYYFYPQRLRLESENNV